MVLRALEGYGKIDSFQNEVCDEIQEGFREKGNVRSATVAARKTRIFTFFCLYFIQMIFSFILLKVKCARDNESNQLGCSWATLSGARSPPLKGATALTSFLPPREMAQSQHTRFFLSLSRRQRRVTSLHRHGGDFSHRLREREHSRRGQGAKTAVRG